MENKEKDVERMLPVPLTQTQKAEVTDILLGELKALKVLELQKKAKAKMFKGEIDQKSSYISELAEQLENGIPKKVECREIHDFDLKLFRVVRLDTGEEVSARDLTEKEYQEDLELNDVRTEPIEEDEEELDPMLDSIRAHIVKESCSTLTISELQREGGIGYNRACRIMDQLEKIGVVGISRGAMPRAVFQIEEESEDDEQELVHDTLAEENETTQGLNPGDEVIEGEEVETEAAEKQEEVDLPE